MNKLLIVDDEERLLRVLRLGFKELGDEVRTAPDGQQALKAIYDFAPDVVVTDMRMPVMSGVELVFEMERLQLGIPVIVMTAHAEVDSAVKALKHGARDYIQKPFTVPELHRVITDVVARLSAPLDNSLELQPSLDESEKAAILKALKAAGNVKAEAARLLKISERTLWYKIKKHGL